MPEQSLSEYWTRRCNFIAKWLQEYDETRADASMSWESLLSARKNADLKKNQPLPLAASLLWEGTYARAIADTYLLLVERSQLDCSWYAAISGLETIASVTWHCMDTALVCELSNGEKYFYSGERYEEHMPAEGLLEALHKEFVGQLLWRHS